MDELEKAFGLLTEATDHLKNIPGFIMADIHNRKGVKVMVSGRYFKSMFAEWETDTDYYEAGMDKVSKKFGGVTVYAIDDRRIKGE